MASERDIPELTTAETAQWTAVRSNIDGMSEGLASGALDAEGLHASINQLRQINLDQQRVINSLHIPDDADNYRDALVTMMLRIPDNWGRWLSCDAGWFPLITELDSALTALDSKYVIHQVKEKFGTLRYYAETDSDAIRPKFDTLIASAEQHSAVTCERCGQPGRLSETEWHWYKTLCNGCINTHTTRNGQSFRRVPACQGELSPVVHSNPPAGRDTD